MIYIVYKTKNKKNKQKRKKNFMENKKVIECITKTGKRHQNKKFNTKINLQHKQN